MIWWESLKNQRSFGKMLVSFDATFLSLIQNSNNLEPFEHRPIWLYRCMYKIIAKIIVMRVKNLLSDSINKEKFSFLSRMQTIGVAHEELHYINTNKLLAMVVKMDLSKAYDWANWLYLRLVLDLCCFDQWLYFRFLQAK